ncbi:MAG: methylmalonyl Co-A mutase-associated GTPase MeaB [Saprospiraceae bacterium]|nr:methylmalonyl Co-A mutase-associated GTPase MeaB [Saprospiraceae bacterium]
MTSNKKIDKNYIKEIFIKLKDQDRIALSRAITLVESQNPKHAKIATDLLEDCLPLSGESIRIGITGTPGVGKSTFIESLGLMYIKNGHKVAVLTIDPSSPKNQGSVLGDKSRMDKLSHHPQAYIRSSPARNSLGGTTDRTRETIVLCEAAKYDVILVETVGVGQSEIEILNMTDLLLLLALPGGGDEIQGIKRGIVEVADIIIVNKKDRFKEDVVVDTVNTYKFALHLNPVKSSKWSRLVHVCSAITGDGMNQIFNDIEKYFNLITTSTYLNDNRRDQNETWLDKKIEYEAISEIKKRIKDKVDMTIVRSYVNEKKWSVQHATSEVLKSIFKN